MNTDLITKALLLIPFIWIAYVVGSIMGIAIADNAKTKQIKLLLLIFSRTTIVLIAIYAFSSMINFKKPSEPLMRAISDEPHE
jgi:hypothetical protein